MAFTMNKLFAGGNLVRDPELRYIPSGSPVCTFDLAINRAYTTQAGEKREDVLLPDGGRLGQTGRDLRAAPRQGPDGAGRGAPAAAQLGDARRPEA